MKEIRKHSSEFKTKVVLESLKNQMTLSELSQKYDLYPGLIQKWKTTFLSSASSVFESPSVKKSDNSKETDRLYQQIGRLQMENEWLKKKL
jgi:transposase-like protein